MTDHILTREEIEEIQALRDGSNWGITATAFFRVRVNALLISHENLRAQVVAQPREVLEARVNEASHRIDQLRASGVGPIEEAIREYEVATSALVAHDEREANE